MLKKAAENPDRTVRLELVTQLKDCSSPEALAILRLAVTDRDREIRRAAVQSIAAQHDEAAFETMSQIIAERSFALMDDADKQLILSAYSTLGGEAAVLTLSKFIARAGSGIRSLQDLKGKTFAFGSPSSTSGHLMPRYFMMQAGVNPDKDLKTVAFSGAHDATVAFVAAGKAEAGVLNTSVWDKLVEQKKKPTVFTNGLNIAAILEAETRVKLCAEPAMANPVTMEEGAIDLWPPVRLVAEDFQEKIDETVVAAGGKPLQLVFVGVGLEADEARDAAVQVSERVGVINFALDIQMGSVGLPERSAAEVAHAVERENRCLVEGRGVIRGRSVSAVVLD